MIHCAKGRIPYLGFTLSEAHSKALKQRATAMLLEAMFTAGDRLYNPELALLMKAPVVATPSGQAKPSSQAAAVKRGVDPAAGATTGVLDEFQAKLAAFKKARGGEKDAAAADKDSDE